VRASGDGFIAGEIRTFFQPIGGVAVHIEEARMDPATMAPRQSVNKKSEFLSDTRKFWQARAPRQLTDEDARQIIENVAGVFSLLAEWDAKRKLGDSAPVGKTATSGIAGGAK
jgi:hypothetical protein